MVCWICPVCGRENSPALRDCPSCPPAAAQPSEPAETALGTRTNGGILALAHNLETIHPFPLVATVPEHGLEKRENGNSSHGPTAATLVEQPVPEPQNELTACFQREEDVTGPMPEAMLVLAEETLAIPVKQSVDSLVRPLVESAEMIETVDVSEGSAPVEPAEESSTVEVLDTVPAASAEPEHPADVIASEPAGSLTESALVEPTEALEVAGGQAPAVPTEHADVVETISVPPIERAEAVEVAHSEPAPQPTESVAIVDEMPAPLIEATQAVSEVAPHPPAPVVEPAVKPEPLAEVAHSQSVAIVDEVSAPPLPAPVVEPAVEPEPLAEVAHSESVSIVDEMPAPPLPAAAVEPAVEPEPLAEVARSESVAIADEMSAPPFPAPVVEPRFEPEPLAEVSEIEAAPTTEVASSDMADACPTPHGERAIEVAPSEAAPSMTEESASAVDPIPAPSNHSPQAIAAESVDPTSLAGVAPSAPEATQAEPAQLIYESQVLAVGLPVSTEVPHSKSDPAALNDGFNLEPTPRDAVATELIAEATTEIAVPVSEAQIAIDWDAPSEDPVQTIDVAAVSAALAENAADLVETIAQKLDIEKAAIRTFAASFERRSATLMLPAPVEILTTPVPPIFDWMRTQQPPARPVPPPPANLASMTAGPQPPTLAGPCLPPELRNPTESRVAKDSQKSRSVPGWMISFAAAMLLLLVALTGFQYFRAQSDGTASSPAPAASSTNAAQNEALAKYLEISGLRLVKSWSGKQQVRFLIINHSPQDLSGVTAQVTVKSDGSPVLLIQAPIRSLGSNQSKEVRTDLDSDVPAYVLSDWQALRTEIRLTSQQ